MALTFHEEANSTVLVVKASGKLSKADYERFVPETDRLIKQLGKIRVLFEMHDFHGWELGGMWEDIQIAGKALARFQAKPEASPKIEPQPKPQIQTDVKPETKEKS